MPQPYKSLCLATFTSCVFGICCAELSAQSSSGAPPKSASGKGSSNTQTQQRSTSGPRATTKTAGVPGLAPLNKRPALQDNRQPLPIAEPMRIPKLSQEMETVLREWEEKSSKITRLEGTFERITYDKVFGVELISTGKYCFKYPDLGSFHQTGKVVTEGHKGYLFPQKPGPDERWICDGTRILKIDDKTRQFEEVTIPPEDRGQNIRNSPLPFLFGMKADEAKQRYYIEINAEKTSETTIFLRVRPLQQQDLANYSRADVILDRETFLPTAVKLYDTTGNKEDVYLFNQKAMSVNGRNWKQWLAGDPLKPDLRGFKKLIAPENAAAPAGQKLANPPNNRRTTAVQPGGSRTQTTKPQIQRTAQIPDDDEPPVRPTTKKRVQP